VKKLGKLSNSGFKWAFKSKCGGVVTDRSKKKGGILLGFGSHPGLRLFVVSSNTLYEFETKDFVRYKARRTIIG